MRGVLAAVLMVGVACAQEGAGTMPQRKEAGQFKLPQPKLAPNVPLSARERAEQMLNRFSFGARPGEVDRVAAMGADAWFAQQLQPGGINDAVLEKRLNDYPTLRMTPEQALAVFPDRGVVQRVADGKQPAPADPLLKSVYEVQLRKLQMEREKKDQATPEPSEEEKAEAKKRDQATASRIAGELFALPRGQRMGALNAMPVEDRMAFANNVTGEQRNTLFAEWSAREREAVYAMQGGVGASYRMYDELAQARVLRSVLSERQVQEVMTEFWFNHFNVFWGKDSDQWYTASYEREAIRPHALGKFRELLLASAQSPAMLVYLDNWLSVGPNSPANGVDPAKPNSKPGTKGLNENYGREVMELHTVGVGGGYTQADVTSLAAILTGWSVDKPAQAGGFQFDAKKHEPGTKRWFGWEIDEDGRVLSGPAVSAEVTAAISAAKAPKGMGQGMTALMLLAGSPQTAHFISYLLAQRFVADAPPAALVDRMAATYQATDGDIAAVLRTLVGSAEFGSHRYFRNKVKMPDEFVASAFRATATDPANPGALVGLLANQLGEPLYKALPPTGYYVTADQWMNTQALMARLNFADQLTHGKFAGQKFDSPKVLALGLMAERRPETKGRAVKVSAGAAHDGGSGADVALRVLEGSLVGGEVSVGTDRFIRSQMAAAGAGPGSDGDTLNLLTALLLGSPEFQVR